MSTKWPTALLIMLAMKSSFERNLFVDVFLFFGGVFFFSPKN